MPQKRNPDAAALMRGKVGRVIGAMNGLLIVVKGLPLTYSKDMQEDKEPVFDTFDTLELCLAAAACMIGDISIHKYRMRAAAGAGYTTATDLADWLVREKNVAFRESHHVAGQVVKLAEEKGCRLEALTAEDLIAVDHRLTADVLNVLTVEASVNSRTSYGGTAPENVRAQVAAARQRFLQGEE